ncbi:class F sortase [Ornithinimicrobium pekingense]|uniref:Class F sortase n=1 Tax=Ornithinimicrobium pekingense TaxID=384677 RepID=A0ABQ2F4J1_9MICO|nr:class F sortase [Ornithinimicrobium pekingense]GGK60277.1 hypothetical protein GCM10011509_05740 [Ornithinimicrobium pekingense]
MAPHAHDAAPRPGAHRRLTVALLVLLVAGALVASWGWRGGSADGPPDAAAPAAPSTSAVTVSPEEAVAATRDATATSRPSPTATSAPTAAPTTAAPTTAPAAGGQAPVHVRITRSAEVLVDAPVGLTRLDERDELNPPRGVVGWYGPPDWSTVPGELSAYPGVLAGHTTHGGAPDVFYRLGEVRAGDTVTIRYADGEDAVFQVDADALSVPKNDVTEKADAEYSWVWSLPEPGRKVSLFSCDLAQGLDLTGHSVNNWVVQATRTS